MVKLDEDSNKLRILVFQMVVMAFKDGFRFIEIAEADTAISVAEPAKI